MGLSRYSIEVSPDKCSSIVNNIYPMREFEKDWQRRFERFACSYKDDHLISGWSERGLRRRVTLFNEILKKQRIPAKARVLDLGCGGGTYVRLLQSHGHKVVGLDYSFPSLFRARDADPKRTADYVGGEAYDLPFLDKSFDLVVSIGVLQALGDPERALDEMARVLRPRGVIVVEFLNAFELVAMIKSASEKLRGWLPRVRTYSPFRVDSWLAQRGLRSVQRAGVFLPPRRFSLLGWVFNRKEVVRMMDEIPGLSMAVAHAFLLVGVRKAG
jgi:ubiquinone/menaquinone biosynthesis C-methylase UbiE